MNKIAVKISLSLLLMAIAELCHPQSTNNIISTPKGYLLLYILLGSTALLFLGILLYQFLKIKQSISNQEKVMQGDISVKYAEYLKNLSSHEIDIYLKTKHSKL